MNFFIDTAAFLAVLNANDRFHPPARQVWDEILASDAILFCSNYVILEITALIQHHFGIDAVRLFERLILPIVEVCWIDETIHRQRMSALLAANRRSLSLVDCTSFEVMRSAGLDTAFTFDPLFRELGFKVVPNTQV